ncbi:unnamed protein product [Nippostrongylus brasiliensis]|uniref:CASP-like protein n=1 Tax=Nippostrongylus brasiliensis TaxID=27835 RepID=A0A0N4YGV4_NIPBR|nr:unnamed protein product [Nippostrongylus brasiliensis]
MPFNLMDLERDPALCKEAAGNCHIYLLSLQKRYFSGGLEWAPPLMVVAVVTLFASTLDLMADFLVCSRIAEFLWNFHSQIAVVAAYGYFFFTGVSVFVYIFEMVDVCQTLKYEEENVFFARLAKSLVLALEEVSFF